MSDEWSLGINDPTIFAWLIVGFYLLGAVGCWRSQKQLSSKTQNEFPSWRLLSWILMLLGLNKQLDFHSLLLMMIHRIQRELAWPLELGLAALLATTTIIATMLLRRYRVVVSSDFRLLSVCGILALLLIVQILRFSTNYISSWLTFHLLSDEGIW
ncbi:MAG: hypothetical protein RLY14_2661, partial [Planctomycetota bacterium]